MKRLLLISLVIIVVGGLVLSGCAEPTPAKTIVLRLSQAEPPEDWMAAENIKMAERFNARTGGAYKMEIYAGEQLVKMPENLDAVRTGAVEMMDVGWGAFAGADIRLGAVELPFFLNNLDASEAAQPALLDLYIPVFEKFNQRALNCYSLGALELISKKPVKVANDWKGLLCQSISPQVSALLDALGASAVSIPFPEAYSSLQKGVIEASIQGVAFFEISKLYEVADYVTLAYPIPATHGYTINMDVWNKMPKNIKDILLEETAASARTLDGVFRELRIDSADMVADRGVEVYTVPAAERNKWKALLEPYVKSQLEQMGDFGTKVKNIADEVNGKYPNP